MYYRKREENSADYMSRHPFTYAEPCTRQENVARNTSITLPQPQHQLHSPSAWLHAKTTGRDPTLRAVMDAVQSGRWYNVAKHPTVDPDHRNNIDTGCVLLFFLSQKFVATKWPIYKGILAHPNLLLQGIRISRGGGE